jgi:hypothetical protein
VAPFHKLLKPPTTEAKHFTKRSDGSKTNSFRRSRSVDRRESPESRPACVEPENCPAASAPVAVIGRSQ